MKALAKKSINVYRNQGLSGLADKGGRYGKKRARTLGNKLRFKKETYDEKRLREESSFVGNEVFQITSADIATSKKATKVKNIGTIRSAVWFIPYVNHFGFNGIQTIFRFVEKMSLEGVKNTIVIYDNPSIDKVAFESQMKSSFPKIKNYKIIVFGEDKLGEVDKLPETDIAFATFWVSAYILLRYNKTKRKYYFIQDYEPQFYEAGSTSALAESTYRFGFRGIVNTPGLLAAVNQRHGLEGISFIPAVDRALYHPDPKQKGNKIRIFMYARPLNPRNAFNLGILTIKHLLDHYGNDKIEIVTAGAEWNESDYGLSGKIVNKGLLKSLQEVADLYRTCDIGFSYMLTPHTSYQMLEYTASGMATVMNHNEDHGWLHQDGVNCLLSEPSPAAMAEKISMLIDDASLRKKLVKAAENELGYTWEQQMQSLWNDVGTF